MLVCYKIVNYSRLGLAGLNADGSEAGEACLIVMMILTIIDIYLIIVVTQN